MATGDAFAPHTRGSTVTTPGGGMIVSVCPAHAGVYRVPKAIGLVPSCLPRTRGGLPRAKGHRVSPFVFAPHTRGSTLEDDGRHFHHLVCPAHAGVYRWPGVANTGTSGLPRTRGGLPAEADANEGGASFAPHTRGSTHVYQPTFHPVAVCPAHAGVYLIPYGVAVLL